MMSIIGDFSFLDQQLHIINRVISVFNDDDDVCNLIQPPWILYIHKTSLFIPRFHTSFEYNCLRERERCDVVKC